MRLRPMSNPVISLVAAMSENGVIGREGGLPWRLKSDLRFFRRLTLGAPIIVGRKTFASFGGPLDKRDNIVISRSPVSGQGVIWAANFEEALAKARTLALEKARHEIFVIGGAEIYIAALPFAERIYLTLVHAKIAGDTHMPHIDKTVWQEVEREEVTAGPDDDYNYSRIVLERKNPHS